MITAEQVEQKVNGLVNENESIFASLSELLFKEMKDFCYENNIDLESSECAAVFNSAQLQLEFKFGFYLTVAKLKAQIHKNPEKRDLDDFNENIT